MAWPRFRPSIPGGASSKPRRPSKSGRAPNLRHTPTQIVEAVAGRWPHGRGRSTIHPMCSRIRALWVGALAVSAWLAVTAHADDPCAGFTWDVAHERALFASAAQTLNAGRDAATAPAIETDRLYELTLAPNEQEIGRASW